MLELLKRKDEEKKNNRVLNEVTDDDFDDSDDGNDSDYEYVGGDDALYDSALDGADELLYLKDCLERFSALEDGG